MRGYDKLVFGLRSVKLCLVDLISRPLHSFQSVPDPGVGLAHEVSLVVAAFMCRSEFAIRIEKAGE